jgi:hypothetical protein
VTPPTNASDDQLDDRRSRPGWHFAVRRYPPTRLWSVSIGHTQRPRTPRSRRQNIARLAVLDTLFMAPYAATWVHALLTSQLDGLAIALSLGSLAFAGVAQWRMIQAAGREPAGPIA